MEGGVTMAAVIKEFDYSKVKGRGRGILGLKGFSPCRKPGSQNSKLSQDEKEGNSGVASKVVVALHNYKANLESPGGFAELPLQKGQLLELLGEHPDNEHWWEVKDEDGNKGFVPSSYVIIKDEQALPWLQATALKSEEEERKIRVRRLAQQQAAHEGRGFGPGPKDGASLPAKKYVSAYNRAESVSGQDSSSFYCSVCEKQLNGPKPYQAHMASKAHKEEVELAESYK